MKYIKKILIVLSIFFILNLLITLLSFYDIFNSKTIHIFKIITFIIVLLILGIITSNNKKKIFINGLKISIILILLLLIISLILPGIELTIKSLIYFIIMSSLIIIGNIIGNKKRKLN